MYQKKTGLFGNIVWRSILPNFVQISSLFINKVGDRVLIGTYGGGMHVFDEKTLQLGDLSREEPFLYGCFFHFTQDRAGHLWIASQEGLYESTVDGHIQIGRAHV